MTAATTPSGPDLGMVRLLGHTRFLQRRERGEHAPASGLRGSLQDLAAPAGRPSLVYPSRTVPPRHAIKARVLPGSLSAVSGARLGPLVILLLVTLALPIYFSVGSFRLSPHRLVLLLSLVPMALAWLSGAAGRIRATDIWVILTCLWIAVVMPLHLGAGAIEYVGINTAEMLGAYLIGRVCIRSEVQYGAVLRILRIVILLLLPAALIESVSGVQIYNKLLSAFPTFAWVNYEQRLNLFRAQTTFEHPILFGVFTALLFAPVYHAAREGRSRVGSLMHASPIAAATFFSLSMGAYLGVIIQIMLMCWGWALRQVRHRWKVLGGLTVAAYVIVDLLSNRTPFQVFSSYITFDAHTAYWRVLIFQYGMENVWSSPFIGIGLADWTRPEWMHISSVDNFWLLFAMRYGIPGFALIFAVYLSTLAALVRARPASASIRRHRDALAFSLIGLGIATCTVHLWGATFVMMMFLLGAGSWIADAPRGDNPEAAPANNPAQDRTVRRGGALTRVQAQALTKAGRPAAMA